MSEQEKPKSFMQELDLWTETNVIGPIESACGSPDFDEVVGKVKAAIRSKVLDSYHNGQRAPARAERGGRYGR